jgi:hypothetical protein
LERRSCRAWLDVDAVQVARARNVLRSKDPSSGLLALNDAEFWLAWKRSAMGG